MTPAVNTNTLFPGMATTATEFFIDQKELKFIHSGRILPFTELSFGIIRILEEKINQDKFLKLELFDMHPTSKMKRIEQFAKCRFGGLDFRADIIDGDIQEGDYWECPLRGSCKSEGILCKLPTYNGLQLQKQDVRLMQLLATDKTNEVIADEMQLPLGSFHKAKKNLYEMLNVQTKQEVVIISIKLNLIQL